VESLQGSNDYLGKYLQTGQVASDGAATELLAHLNKVLSQAEIADPSEPAQTEAASDSMAGVGLSTAVELEGGCKGPMRYSSLDDSSSLENI
jgi:hypothetical protein